MKTTARNVNLKSALTPETKAASFCFADRRRGAVEGFPFIGRGGVGNPGLTNACRLCREPFLSLNSANCQLHARLVPGYYNY